MSACSKTSLRILQCLRAPVGGLFRHVCDLVRAQADAGHDVGIVCDSTTGGDTALKALSSLEKYCALGIHRIAMPRQIGPSDWTAIRWVSEFARERGVDILHGHGAKGGAYIRLANPGKHISPLRFYTPHGGSLHYSPYSIQGLIFLNLERILLSRTDGLIFESEYAQTTYAAKVHAPACLQRIIYNGVGDEEFHPVTPAKEQTDLLFVGELRALKGVATLLEAVHKLKASGTPLTVTIVGRGPDDHSFRKLAANLGIDSQVRFPGAIPAHKAFALGRTLVVPSHKESFPYIVLEAAAANVPMIATRVGGIPEIFGQYSSLLVEPQNAEALTAAIQNHLSDRQFAVANAARLQKRVQETFNIKNMARDVLQFYLDSGGVISIAGESVNQTVKDQNKKLSTLSG